MKRLSTWAGLVTWAALLAMIGMAIIPGAGLAEPAVPAAPTANPSQIIFVDALNQIEVVSLGSDGVLRAAWDSSRVAGQQRGWTNFTTGDFNGDGNQEIVAIRINTSQAGVIHVFQPVQSTTQPVNLDYTLATGQTFHLLATGDFEGMGRDQIIATYNWTDNTGRTWEQIVEYFPTNASGTSWSYRLVSAPFANTWKVITAGDLNRDGRAELVLARDIDKDVLVMTGQNGVWSILWESNQFCSDCNWYSMAIGRVTNDSNRPGNQLVLARASSSGSRNALLVFTWDGSNMVDISTNPPSLYFYPNFTDVALARLVYGASSSQIIGMRPLPNDPAYTNIPFMAMVNFAGTAGLPAFEPKGDYGTNSWQHVAAGDLNGDGRDEVAVLRSTHLRVYDRPWQDTHSVSDLSITAITTNLMIARIGFGAAATLSVSPLVLNYSANRGMTVPSQSVSISNATSNLTFPWNAEVVGNPSWVSLNKTSGTAGPTPDTLTVSVDSTRAAQGPNTATVRVWSDDPLVGNASQNIVVNFNVLTPVFLVTPTTLNLDLNYGDITQQSVFVGTGTGVQLGWTAVEQGTVPWLLLNDQAQSATGIRPGYLTLKIDTALMSLGTSTATVHIVGVSGGATVGSEDVTITVVVRDAGVAVRPSAVTLWTDKSAPAPARATLEVVRPVGKPVNWTAEAVDLGTTPTLQELFDSGRAKINAQGRLEIDGAPAAAPVWLTVQPGSGQAGQSSSISTVLLTANPATVNNTNGVYRALVVFVASDPAQPGNVTIKQANVTYIITSRAQRAWAPLIGR